MSNCIFGWPIWNDATPSQTPTATGGSWLAALPASNVLDRRLAKVARSTALDPSQTKITLDLGTSRSIGVLAVLVPNITVSSTPTVQFFAGPTLGSSSTYDSGVLQAVPSSLAIEDVTGADGSRLNLWRVVTPTPFSSRFPSLVITDTGNADGYLNVARVIIAGAFQPAITMNDGDHFGEESESARNLTDGGAAVYTAKRQRRTHQFGINNLTSAESLATLRRMKRQLGTSQQFMWIPDPADTTYAYERNYLATLRSLSPLESFATRYNSTFEVVEEL